jgi:glycerol kinase
VSDRPRSGPLLLGIDEGTTAVKAALFEADLTPFAQARRGVPVSHPRPGWVEQDPELILEAVVEAVAEVLETAGGRAVAAAGLDHQGESVLAWDAASGRALSPVIVWQDKRHEELLEGIDAAVPELTGLPLDPYFSAGKLAWLLNGDPSLRAGAAAGRVRLGTVDAFLTDRLGGRFATDLSTASRTQLLALGGRDWDERLLGHFGLERAMLPQIGPSFGELGTIGDERWGRRLELRAQLVDQQAALAGSGAVAAGQAKATYGTGVFVLARTPGPAAAAGLVPTVAWAGPGAGGSAGPRPAEPAYALDGGVFAAGALLEWLAGGLGLAEDPPALAALAATVADSGGVMLLPALAGLGSPWWVPGARGVIAGLDGGVRPAHVARAALEGIAHRVADVVEAMAAVVEITALRVDGGLSNDETLLGLQADLLGLDLIVGRADATVLGAALLAGVGAGLFATVEQGAGLLGSGRRIAPRLAAEERLAARRAWRTFVTGAAAL